jgi:hypothetical protein
MCNYENILTKNCTNTFNKSDELINYLNQLLKEKKYAYRGLCIEKELLPKIIRDKDYRDKEINLLAEFEKYGGQYYSANNPLDFVSYAEHYGLPTRLLDYTYNPLIALYFSLFDSKNDNEDIYYYICFSVLEEQICFKYLPIIKYLSGFELNSMATSYRLALKALEIKTDENKQRKYFQMALWDENPALGKLDSDKEKDIDKIVDKFKENKILFIDPNLSNQRITAQQGLFLMPYNLDKENHMKMIYENSKFIGINKKIRIELLKYLDTIGINSFILMPDLQNVCEGIKRRLLLDIE